MLHVLWNCKILLVKNRCPFIFPYKLLTVLLSSDNVKFTFLIIRTHSSFQLYHFSSVVGFLYKTHFFLWVGFELVVSPSLLPTCAVYGLQSIGSQIHEGSLKTSTFPGELVLQMPTASGMISYMPIYLLGSQNKKKLT